MRFRTLFNLAAEARERRKTVNPFEWPWWVLFLVGWAGCAFLTLSGVAIEIAHNKECMEFCSRGGNANVFRHRHEGLTIALLGAGFTVFLLGILGMFFKLLS